MSTSEDSRFEGEWEGSTYPQVLARKKRREEEYERDKQRQQERKARMPERLQELLVEATTVENALDMLYSQHKAALKRLEQIKMIAQGDTQPYHDYYKTMLEPVSWTSGRSLLLAEPTLVTTEVEGTERVLCTPSLPAPDELWTTTSIDRAKNPRSKILFRAFATLWRELGWDDELKGSWYWMSKDTDSKSIDTSGGHLRVTVLRQTTDDGHDIHSYLRFEGA